MADTTLERKKLLDYLPEFTKQFHEIQEIMKTEEREMEKININILKIL